MDLLEDEKEGVQMHDGKVLCMQSSLQELMQIILVIQSTFI